MNNQTIDGVSREDFTYIALAARCMTATTGTKGWGNAVKCFSMLCTPYAVIRMTDEIERLRALLDVPVEDWSLERSELDSAGTKTLFHFANAKGDKRSVEGVTEKHARLYLPKPSAQPQGEPVAWRYKKSLEKDGWVTCEKHPTDYGIDEDCYTIQALYAEKPKQND